MGQHRAFIFTTAVSWVRSLVILAITIVLVGPEIAPAYSVLTHEQVVDLVWKDRIEPLLRKRFPRATEEDLRKAHAYAYGGSLLQDMGYYPFGNKFFSDLVHYVRTGDFVVALLEGVFVVIYGLKVSDVFGDEDLAIGTFRRSVCTVIPEMTRVALLARKKQLVKEVPNFDRKKFLYNLSRTTYEKEWGKGYRKPGFRERLLAWFLKIMPKIGPFRALDFKIPTPQTEDMYIKSVNQTLEDFQTTIEQAKGKKLKLDNRDCDTGKETSPGEYQLRDRKSVV